MIAYQWDIRSFQKERNFMNIEVSEYTSVDPMTVNVKESFDIVFHKMMENNIRHLPVLEQDKVVGIISQRDLLAHLKDAQKKTITARDLMNSDVTTVYENAPLDKVCFDMSSNKIGSVIIFDNSDQLLGLFTTTDALNALVEIVRGDIKI